MAIDNLLNFTHAVGANVTNAQTNLMEAFSLTENKEDVQKVADLATKMNIIVQTADGKPAAADLKGLQLIAQRRFEHSAQIFSTFSNIMDKLDQLKQRLIQKLGQ